MLLRISLIVAILAALGAGVLGYLEVSKQIPALTQQRDDENQAKHKYMGELDNTNKLLVITKKDLSQTKQQLADAQTERDHAIAKAETESKRADDLNTKLTQTSQEREDARNQLAAYTSTGLTADQVARLNKDYVTAQKTIDAVNGEKVVMLREITRLTNEIAQLVSPDNDVKLPATMLGKITAVDPKWDFVVVDVGENEGMINNGELLVSRDGKLVGKVIVRRVQKDKSIANFVPGWQFGEMLEGDVVSPAHPTPAS